MKTKNIIIPIFFLAGIFSLPSCKDEFKESTVLSVNQAFSPTALMPVIVNKTGVRLTWNAVKNAKTYTIEIFENGNLDFSGTPVKVIEGISFIQVPYTVTGLAGATSYSVRVKAVGEGIEDSKYISDIFKTETEQIFQDIAPAKLLSRSITLNWTPGENATSITITPGNITRTVTPQEISAGQVTITGLTPKTTYTATLLLNTAIRGTKSFTTPSELPTGADVVYVAPTDNLANMIEAATTSTRFVVLEGSKYDANFDATTSSFKTVILPAGIDISIIGEASINNKAIISFNGITLPASAGKIHFENVNLTGYAKGDVTTAKRNYIFNQSTATSTAQISFENCIIQNFVNSPMRIQSTNVITIDKFIVNNCLIDDIGVTSTTGTYAFIHSNVANGKINNITITNNTFSNIGYGLILHGTSPSLSVTVENNTFYNVIGDTRYLVDFNTQVIPNGISFKNNILGKTLSAANTARGIRASGGVITTSDNYQTSDATITSNVISGITTYTGSSAALFTAPNSKNFKILDNTFAGKSNSGDPRWRL